MALQTSFTVEDGLAWFAETLDEVAEETLHLCRIPGPTFDEVERATYAEARMRAIGLDDVQVDDMYNVTGGIEGSRRGPTTLVAAHIDTVFPRGTPLEVRRTSNRLYGPSIGDNSVAVTGMLQVAQGIRRLDELPPGRIIFAANVGEEGLGNLCGIRALLEKWRDQVDTVLAVEGHGVDEIRNAGIGSTRLEITFEGEGGHSWGAFGTPSAIHAMGSAIHKISRLKMSQQPKTSYNVGLVEGGESINTIAPRATMLLDLRSVAPASLYRLEQRVTRIFETVAQDTGIRIESRMVGQRPAATLDIAHPLCQQMQGIRKRLRLRQATFSASSTDANLPLSQGIPSLCLGMTRGGLAHTVREYIDIPPILLGLRQLYLAILASLEPSSYSGMGTE
ncbi:M20/M25/M40 family metallo-hydrolase [Candidatus Entotheonella palauensis]|nr:M20/M25/M40 family metallo-hydrolase [Candidatus Entotheonella palauensis]